MDHSIVTYSSYACFITAMPKQWQACVIDIGFGTPLRDRNKWRSH